MIAAEQMTLIKIKIFFAPGRVNLIGEHIDYNGGYVFPAALNFGIHLILRKNNDQLLRLASKNYADTIEVPIENLPNEKSNAWYDYPLGVIAKVFLEAEQKKTDFQKLSGVDVLFYSDLPTSCGLSSSASIEVVTAYAFNACFSCGLELIEIIKLCQQVENQYIGVNCGIMDQFAVSAAKKDSAILLHCDTLAYEHVPIDLHLNSSSPLAILVMNTNKPRNLTVL